MFIQSVSYRPAERIHRTSVFLLSVPTSVFNNKAVKQHQKKKKYHSIKNVIEFDLQNLHFIFMIFGFNSLNMLLKKENKPGITVCTCWWHQEDFFVCQYFQKANISIQVWPITLCDMYLHKRKSTSIWHKGGGRSTNSIKFNYKSRHHFSDFRKQA